MNQDLPYDQFVRYQIAGDLLPTASPDEVNADAITATGLLTIGSWGAGDADVQKMYSDMVDDQINVVSRAFLGLSVGCARCHDHKFDPIPTADYYGLAGIFFSTQIAIPQISAPYNKVPLVLQVAHRPLQSGGRRDQGQARRSQKFVDAQYAALPEQHVAETGKYLLAVYDYQHRPAENRNRLRRNLPPRCSCVPTHSVNGSNISTAPTISGCSIADCQASMARRGSSPGAAQAIRRLIVLNTLGEPAELPGQIRPHGVGVHPGPNSGVGVDLEKPAYRHDQNQRPRGPRPCPMRQRHCLGRAKIREQAAQLHSAGGELPRGGEQQFSTLPTVQQVPIAAGESIRIIVLPGGEHSCDMSAPRSGDCRARRGGALLESRRGSFGRLARWRR